MGKKPIPNSIGILTLKRPLFLVMAVLVALFSCDFFSQPGERVVIRVGERHITENDFKGDIKRLTLEMGLSDQKVGQFMDPLVHKIVDHYLILEYGRDRGINLTQEEFDSALRAIKRDYPDKSFQETLLQGYIDFEEWKLSLKEQLLVKKILKKVSEGITPISYQKIKAYFDANRNQFRRPQMVRFRQVVTRTADEAKKILDLLSQGKHMRDLAIEYSIAPEAKKGGEVGWIAKGELEESMENVIFSLPVGKPSPATKTPYGYHVFEVLSKRPGGLKSFSEAMEEIESKLFDEKQNSFYTKWLNGLRDIFPIEVNLELINKMELG